MIDVQELSRIRGKAKEALAVEVTPSDVAGEFRRYEETQRVISALPKILKTAAKNGMDEVCLLRLDEDVLYRTSRSAGGTAVDKTHLQSEAYQRLWDNLVQEGLEPFIHESIGGKRKALFLAVQLP